MPTERVSLLDFMATVFEMEDEDSILLSEVLFFDEATWLLRAFYDDFSDSIKLLLTHCTESDIYPSTVFDLPTEKGIASWKVWFEHVLRCKSLLTQDKYLYVDKECWDYMKNKDKQRIDY